MQYGEQVLRYVSVRSRWNYHWHTCYLDQFNKLAVEILLVSKNHIYVREIKQLVSWRLRQRWSALGRLENCEKRFGVSTRGTCNLLQLESARMLHTHQIVSNEKRVPSHDEALRWCLILHGDLILLPLFRLWLGVNSWKSHELLHNCLSWLGLLGLEQRQVNVREK